MNSAMARAIAMVVSMVLLFALLQLFASVIGGQR
jgi:hypothetical protein